MGKVETGIKYKPNKQDLHSCVERTVKNNATLTRTHNETVSPKYMQHW